MRVPRDVLNVEDGNEPWNFSPGYGAEVDIPESLALPNQQKGILGPTQIYPGAYPEVWTLSCALTYDTNPATWLAGSTPAGRVFALLGVLQFGTGAAQQQMEFDWINGVQLTVPMCTVKLAVKLEPTLLSPVPAKAKASCVLSPGGTTRERAPTRTIYLGSAPPYPADQTIAIPRFAKSFSFAANTFDPATVITVLTAPTGGGILYTTTAAALVASAANGLGPRLWGAAKYVRVVGTWNNGQLIFQLDG
jgi:hypothetical protein